MEAAHIEYTDDLAKRIHDGLEDDRRRAASLAEWKRSIEWTPDEFAMHLGALFDEMPTDVLEKMELLNPVAALEWRASMVDGIANLKEHMNALGQAYESDPLVVMAHKMIAHTEAALAIDAAAGDENK